ncbi:protein PTHB1 [Belonocnema kinseyi]|uniref:protein PTHB1 n=1 Tax=Belonocnema kinseyi TaxID=2817044 RepID=UPI00143D299B|nr:protein PTHB1 [Belonocnema kinseyi]
MEDSVQLGDKCRLEVEYEHQLPSVAMSLTIGAFGGGHERDFLCVQFVNGTLLFLEQEIYSFSRILKNRLHHEPLVYLQATDVFVTQNADWGLAFYKYQSLAELGRNKNESKVSWIAEPDRTYKLGEAILTIDSVTLSTMETGIIVMSERNLYFFNDTHLSVKFTKRHAYNVLCSQSYIMEPDGKLFFIVVTDTKAVMIYEGSSLIWSAELPFVPIAVTVTRWQGIEGLIVILSEDGQVEVCFLGTQASLYTARCAHRRQCNYFNAEREIADLRLLIRKCINYGKENIPKVYTDLEVQVTADMNPLYRNKISTKSTPSKQKGLTLINNVNIKSDTFISNIQVYVETLKPCIIVNDNWALFNLRGQYICQSLIIFGSETPILSAELEIIVTYENDDCETHVMKKDLLLSVQKVCTACSPIIMRYFKISIRNYELVDYIFKQLLSEFKRNFPHKKASNAFSLGLFQQEDVVTLTFDLPMNEIHIHSNDELATLLVINHCIKKMPDKGTESLYINIEQDKMHLIFDVMKAYSNSCLRSKNIKKEMRLLTSQLRNIIRKMLHIKERNFQLSTDTELLMVLNISCQKTFAMVENFIDAEMKQIQAANSLYCILKLILNIQSFNSHEDIWVDLESAIGFQLQSEIEITWEDVTKYALGTIFGEKLNYLEEQLVPISSEKFDRTKSLIIIGKLFSSIIERNILIAKKFVN